MLSKVVQGATPSTSERREWRRTMHPTCVRATCRAKSVEARAARSVQGSRGLCESAAV